MASVHLVQKDPGREVSHAVTLLFFGEAAF